MSLTVHFQNLILHKDHEASWVFAGAVLGKPFVALHIDLGVVILASLGTVIGDHLRAAGYHSTLTSGQVIFLYPRFRIHFFASFC